MLKENEKSILIKLVNDKMNDRISWINDHKKSISRWNNPKLPSMYNSIEKIIEIEKMEKKIKTKQNELNELQILYDKLIKL